MNVKELIEQEIAALEASAAARKQQIEADAAATITRLRARLEALPPEVHALESEAWDKVKAFFHEHWFGPSQAAVATGVVGTVPLTGDTTTAAPAAA